MARWADRRWADSYHQLQTAATSLVRLEARAKVELIEAGVWRAVGQGLNCLERRVLGLPRPDLRRCWTWTMRLSRSNRNF